MPLRQSGERLSHYRVCWWFWEGREGIRGIFESENRRFPFFDVRFAGFLSKLLMRSGCNWISGWYLEICVRASELLSEWVSEWVSILSWSRAWRKKSLISARKSSYESCILNCRVRIKLTLILILSCSCGFISRIHLSNSSHRDADIGGRELSYDPLCPAWRGKGITSLLWSITIKRGCEKKKRFFGFAVDRGCIQNSERERGSSYSWGVLPESLTKTGSLFRPHQWDPLSVIERSHLFHSISFRGCLRSVKTPSDPTIITSNNWWYSTV